MGGSERRTMNTTQLLSMIKRTNSFSKVDKALHESVDPTEFCHYLYQLMSQHGLKPKDVISGTELERSYFYHILSGNKLPSRNVVLRIGLSLGATLNEVNRLLLLAAQGALYPKVRRDAAIIYCIEHKYTMKYANDFLKKIGEQPMYKE